MVRRGQLVTLMVGATLVAACSGTEATRPQPTGAPAVPTVGSTAPGTTASTAFAVVPPAALVDASPARVLAVSLDGKRVRVRVLLPPAACGRSVSEPAFGRHAGVWFAHVVSGQTDEQRKIFAGADCIVLPAEQVVVEGPAREGMAPGDPAAVWTAEPARPSWRAEVVPLGSPVDVEQPVAEPRSPELPALVPLGLPDVAGQLPAWPAPPDAGRDDATEPWVAYLVDAAAGPGARAVRLTLADAAPPDVDPGSTTTRRAVRSRRMAVGVVAVAEGHGVDGATLEAVLTGATPGDEPATLTLGPPPDGLTVLAAGRPVDPVVVAYPWPSRYFPGDELLLTHRPSAPTALAEFVTRPDVPADSITIDGSVGVRVSEAGVTSAVLWFTGPDMVSAVRGPLGTFDRIEALARRLYTPTAADAQLYASGWGNLGQLEVAGCAGPLRLYGGWGPAGMSPGGYGDDLRLLLVNDSGVDCPIGGPLALAPLDGERVQVVISGFEGGLEVPANGRTVLSTTWSTTGERCPIRSIVLDWPDHVTATDPTPVRMAMCDGATASATAIAL